MAKGRNWELSQAIVGHFEVMNTDLPCLESYIGLVDFRTITLDQAEKLHSKGSRYLKKIVKSNKKETPTD